MYYNLEVFILNNKKTIRSVLGGVQILLILITFVMAFIDEVYFHSDRIVTNTLYQTSTDYSYGMDTFFVALDHDDSVLFALVFLASLFFALILTIVGIASNAKKGAAAALAIPTYIAPISFILCTVTLCDGNYRIYNYSTSSPTSSYYGTYPYYQSYTTVETYRTYSTDGIFYFMLVALALILVLGIIRTVLSDSKNAATAQPVYNTDIYNSNVYNTAYNTSNQTANSDLRVCASCGCALLPDDNFCAKCGTKVAPQDTAKFCPSCGNKISDGQSFCSFCGQKL